MAIFPIALQLLGKMATATDLTPEETFGSVTVGIQFQGRTPTWCAIPTWGLTNVRGRRQRSTCPQLEGLKCPLFESLLGVSIKPLSVKVVLLLALASAKLVIGIHALSVSPACAQFALENILMVLKSNPVFVPKVVGSCSALGLAAFAFPGEQLAHMLHLVQAVCSCVDRTQSIRRSNQLFVLRAESCKGQSVTKPRLTH